MFVGEVDREVLIAATMSGDCLADFERGCAHGYFTSNDPHEVADDDKAAVAQLGYQILPITRYMHYHRGKQRVHHRSVSHTCRELRVRCRV